MIILGIDCASISCSVGVLKTDKLKNELTGEFENNGLTHSQTLAPMIERVFKKAQITAKDIDLIAVTKGPGSFTGLRIGMATAKGLAAPSFIPCVCVSTLEAIASTAAQVHKGILCAVMDARCSQVYNALFKVENGQLTRLIDDRAVSIAELEEELKKYNELITLCGDGVDVCVKNFKEIKVEIAKEQVRLPQGTAVCSLAQKYKTKAISPEKISPAYLRLPQASRELLKKKKEN